MDLGKDIVQKIRSAVKSKLLDLGSYVDDELPDYVMVMVANKKNESQMIDDLSLFLGEKTSKFTSWLHKLLDKLNSISVDCSLKEDVISKKKSGRTTGGSKRLSESKSPDHAKEILSTAKVVMPEVFETEISLKSEWDDIDREDDGDVIAITPEKSSEAAVPKVKPTRKRTHGSSTNRQQSRSHREKSDSVHEVRGIEKTHVQPANHMPPIQPIQPMQRAAAVLVANTDKPLSLPQQKQDQETIKSDTTKSSAVLPPPPSDSEDHFYPYEISGDVEMISHDEFSSEETRVVTVTASTMRQESMNFSKRAEKGDAEIKSRKIFMSGRSLGPWPERNVSLMNAEEGLPSVLPSSSNQTTDGPVSEVTNFIVTLNGAYDHLGDRIFDCEMEEEERFTDSPGQPQVGGWSPLAIRSHLIGSKPLVICDNGDDEEEDDIEDDNNGDDDDRPFKRQKTLERCRYWPNCKAGNNCTYHHPYRPCKAFPNCRYKEKCLFIHPECKFDSSCTSLACPFVHSSPRSFITAPPTVILQPIRVPVRRVAPRKPHRQPIKLPPSKLQCRFFPKCVDMNCPYSHPKPCRYGLSCNQKSRCSFSHPSLPSKDKLKWCAKMEDVQLIRQSVNHL